MILHGLHAMVWVAALIALISSAYTDIKDRIIPNELSGMVAVCGLVMGLLTWPGQVWISIAAAIATLFALGTLAHYGLLGGGDVKMIAATTLLIPPAQIGKLLLFIVLAGGLLSCLYIAARYAISKRWAGQCRSPAQPVDRCGPERPGWFARECARIAHGGPMPYGVAIFGGVAGVLAGEFPRCLPADFCLL